MAESLLIQALTFATQHQPRLTNLAKVDYTKFLIPSLRYREGSLRHSDLTNSLIVKIRPGSLTGRTSPTAESDDFGLTVRCNRWWPLNKAVKEKRDIRYLVAVTSGVKPSRVIGVWETNPVSDWWREKQGEPQPREFDGDPWNGPLAESLDLKVDRWVATVRSTDSDINNWQGLEFDWEGYRPQNVGWSNDIR